MANNHDQFIAFDKAITASSSRRDTLKTNRDALRKKIRKHFKDNWPDKPQPSFLLARVIRYVYATFTNHG